MRRPSWFPSACVSLGLLLASGSAFAQMVTVSTPLRPARDDRGNPNRLKPFEVNRTDCLADDSIRYPIVVSGATGGLTLEVWAGSNCSSLDSRESNSSTCWLVYTDTGPETDNIDIRVRDVITGALDKGTYSNPGDGTQAACDKGESNSRSVPINFYLVDSSKEVKATGTPDTSLDFDLLGPEPPDGIEVGIGEESLVVSFDSETDDSSNSDISKYYVYCDVAGEGVGGAGTDASGCGSSTLEPGQPPPDAQRCGSTTKLSQEVQTDDDLENGTTYAVGIAAVDAFGNPGNLSSIACATPEPINGFFEEYRAAGGKGGGGFCSLSRTNTARSLWLSAAGLATALLIRRRVKGGRR